MRTPARVRASPPFELKKPRVHFCPRSCLWRSTHSAACIPSAHTFISPHQSSSEALQTLPLTIGSSPNPTPHHRKLSKPYPSPSEALQTLPLTIGSSPNPTPHHPSVSTYPRSGLLQWPLLLRACGASKAWVCRRWLGIGCAVNCGLLCKRAADTDTSATRTHRHVHVLLCRAGVAADWPRAGA
jgi:hypothetical protein